MSDQPETNAAQLDDSDKDAPEGLDPRTAQSRLEEAFNAPDEEGVVTIGDGEVPQRDNPFAAEASALLALRKLEALLFASPKPLTVSMLADRLDGVDVPELLERLQAHYEGRGIELRCVDEKWQFVTAPDVSDVLVEHRTQERRLSRAALETLAIIAYHQPCSRADIEEVRGVAVAKGSLDQLLELGWVKIKGRREVPGRPLLYGTTPSFLEHFGLESIKHLPGLQDLKSAGLLDARLPPGFSVPVPSGEAEDEEGAHDLVEDADFVQDFHDEETPEVEPSDQALDQSVDEDQ